jgi:hypothetical protein|nr:MAG TPA: hypothetical protein [Caudoviricetes sp.]
MNKYVIKFSHVKESEYTAIVEVIDIFEESPFDYLEDEEPDSVQGHAFHVSKVTEDGEVVYEKSKKLNVEYC